MEKCLDEVANNAPRANYAKSMMRTGLTMVKCDGARVEIYG